MNIVKTNFEGLFIIEPIVHFDNRGYFAETFKLDFFKENFPDIEFVQENESHSSNGVIRGLHFQKKPFDQTKLVRVLNGEILDVVIDLRKDSKTFNKYFSVRLSEKNKKQLLIPRGFAHGFLTISKQSKVLYKTDNIYSKEHEGVIKFDDKRFQIDWGIEKTKIITSIKDNSIYD